MLITKGGLNTRSKILLAVLGVIVVGGGTYLYFSSRAPVTDSPAVDSPAVSSAPLASVPSLDGLGADNPQLYRLTTVEPPTFTLQHEATALDPDAPLPPRSVLVHDTQTGGQLVVSWQYPTPTQFATVKVYRSEEAGTLGEEVGTVTAGAAGTYGMYRDTGLTDGTSYYYSLKGVVTEEVVSSPTKQYAGTPSDTTAPAAPANVQVTSGADQEIVLSWVTPNDEDLAAIRIYRAAEAGVLGNLLATVPPNVPAGAPDRYTDVKVTANATYFYTLTSIDTSGNESSTDVLAAPYNYNPFIPIDF